MKKAMIVLGVLGLAGGGLYLYFRSKKKSGAVPNMSSNLNNTTAQPVVGSSTTISGPAPTQKEIVIAAADVIVQAAQTTKQAAAVAYSDSPVPLPGDMTVAELQNLNYFCQLPTGSKNNFPIGSSLMTLNTNIETKWGLSNTLKKRSGAPQSYDDYFKALKTYRGC